MLWSQSIDQWTGHSNYNAIIGVVACAASTGTAVCSMSRGSIKVCDLWQKVEIYCTKSFVFLLFYLKATMYASLAVGCDVCHTIIVPSCYFCHP